MKYQPKYVIYFTRNGYREKVFYTYAKRVIKRDLKRMGATDIHIFTNLEKYNNYRSQRALVDLY